MYLQYAKTKSDQKAGDREGLTNQDDYLFHGFRIREVLLYSVENARLGPPMYLGFQSWWCGEEQVTSLIYVVSFLSRVSHTNIVKLFETYDDKTRVYLVMEL